MAAGPARTAGWVCLGLRVRCLPPTAPAGWAPPAGSRRLPCHARCCMWAARLPRVASQVCWDGRGGLVCRQGRAGKKTSQLQMPCLTLIVSNLCSTGLLASPPEKRQQAALGRLPLPPASSGLHRVASEGTLHSAKSGAATSGSLQQHTACNGEVPGPDGWPAAHAFTTISKVYAYRTVVLNWRDPRIPGMLRPIIQASPLGAAECMGWVIWPERCGIESVHRLVVHTHDSPPSCQTSLLLTCGPVPPRRATSGC